MRKQGISVSMILLAFVIAQSIVIVSLLYKGSSTIDVIAWISSVVIPLALFSYDLIKRKSLRFFLFAQRIKNLMGGRSATWDFAVTFNGNFSEKDIQAISTALQNNERYSGLKITQQGRLMRNIMIPGGINAELSVQSDPNPFDYATSSLNQIHFAIQNLRVSFRDTEEILDKKVIPLVNLMSSTLKVVSQVYGMTVAFDKASNPFFGLYLDKINPDDISDFRVLLVINDYEEKDQVTITQSKIQIVAHSPSAISNLGKEFLTFQPNLRLKLGHG